MIICSIICVIIYTVVRVIIGAATRLIICMKSEQYEVLTETETVMGSRLGLDQ